MSTNSPDVGVSRTLVKNTLLKITTSIQFRVRNGWKKAQLMLSKSVGFYTIIEVDEVCNGHFNRISRCVNRSALGNFLRQNPDEEWSLHIKANAHRNIFEQSPILAKYHGKWPFEVNLILQLFKFFPIKLHTNLKGSRKWQKENKICQPIGRSFYMVVFINRNPTMSVSIISRPFLLQLQPSFSLEIMFWVSTKNYYI
jgi:hypothetical protein